MPDSTHGSVAFLVTLILIISLPLAFLNQKAHKAEVIVKASAQEKGAAQNITPSPSPVRAVVVPQSEQDDIDAYVRTIFGKDAKVALAVQRVECNPKNKAYPRCVYHTKHEYSVGIFQINLFNANHWIHAKKVPGVTMDEKIEWLKDPYHNTLIAYKIFTDSGFEPWAGYTSGRYLDHMGE